MLMIFHFLKAIEYDQKMPQSLTLDQPTALQGRDTKLTVKHSKNTIKVKQDPMGNDWKTRKNNKYWIKK